MPLASPPPLHTPRASVTPSNPWSWCGNCRYPRTDSWQVRVIHPTALRATSREGRASFGWLWGLQTSTWPFMRRLPQGPLKSSTLLSFFLYARPQAPKLISTCRFLPTLGNPSCAVRFFHENTGTKRSSARTNRPRRFSRLLYATVPRPGIPGRVGVTQAN